MNMFWELLEAVTKAKIYYRLIIYDLSDSLVVLRKIRNV